jgi:hypothetical protein
MSFENLYLMLLLLVPFILFALLVSTNKDGVERVFPQNVLDRIRVEGSGVSNRARDILLFSAIFMMIIAVGHPYIAKGERDVKLGGLEIVPLLTGGGATKRTTHAVAILTRWLVRTVGSAFVFGSPRMFVLHKTCRDNRVNHG